MREYKDEIDRMRARQNRKKSDKAAWKKEIMKPVEDPNSFWFDADDSEDLEDPDLEEFWLEEEDAGPEEDYWLDEEPIVLQKLKKQKTDNWDDDLEEISLDSVPYKKTEIEVMSFDKNAARSMNSTKETISKGTQKKKTTPSSMKAASQGNQGESMSKPCKKKKKRRHHWFRNILILLLLFCGIFFWFQKKEDGFWTVAVFGVDSRDGSLEKGAHSDVIMLSSLNRATGEIKLVSVYRDTYLKTDTDDGYGKINSSYFKGGHEQAIAALEENLDLKIDDYATFSWAAVADAISTLGGVDVEITESEFEYINAFITETVESTGLGSVHLEHSGLNHLDGVQAVAYARLRLMDTDYNRTARQRLILSLTMEKAKQASFSTLSEVAMSVLPQISTSIDISDILSLAKRIDRYYLGENTGFPFSRGEARIHKQSCVIPLTLESNVTQLHQFLYGTEHYTPSAAVRKISNQIARDSGMGEVAENAPEISAGHSNSAYTNNHSASQTEQNTGSQTEVVPAESETVSETSEEASEAESESDSSADIEEIPPSGEVFETETGSDTFNGPSASLEETTEAGSETSASVEKGPGMKPTPDEESSIPLEIPNGPGFSNEENGSSIAPGIGPGQ